MDFITAIVAVAFIAIVIVIIKKTISANNEINTVIETTPIVDAPVPAPVVTTPAVDIIPAGTEASVAAPAKKAKAPKADAAPKAPKKPRAPKAPKAE